MAAHLRKRGSTYYLIDGEIRRSLKTDKKGLAEARLKQYLREEFKFWPRITVKGYYDQWINTKKPPVVRQSAASDYRQHFTAYILPAFQHGPLSKLSTKMLDDFRTRLLESQLSIKTARNVIDSSFRAMWRDAMIEEIVEHNPFALLKWPRLPRLRPDPFSVEDRDKILEWWETNDFFFYPYVFFQFHTGCRPSETAALRWPDVDLEHGMVNIRASLVMGEEGATKTEGADRIIPVSEPVFNVLKILPSRKLGLEFVFVGKRGNPMTKKWAEHNWKEPLRELGIRHRKFYCTRHTFITEMVKAGKNLKDIADYCGTSVAMIEKDYCGRQGLNLVGTISAQQKLSSENVRERLVAGPGFEPGTSRL